MQLVQAILHMPSIDPARIRTTEQTQLACFPLDWNAPNPRSLSEDVVRSRLAKEYATTPLMVRNLQISMQDMRPYITATIATASERLRVLRESGINYLVRYASEYDTVALQLELYQYWMVFCVVDVDTENRDTIREGIEIIQQDRMITENRFPQLVSHETWLNWNRMDVTMWSDLRDHLMSQIQDHALAQMENDRQRAFYSLGVRSASSREWILQEQTNRGGNWWARFAIPRARMPGRAGWITWVFDHCTTSAAIPSILHGPYGKQWLYASMAAVPEDIVTAIAKDASQSVWDHAYIYAYVEPLKAWMRIFVEETPHDGTEERLDRQYVRMEVDFAERVEDLVWLQTILSEWLIAMNISSEDVEVGMTPNSVFQVSENLNTFVLGDLFLRNPRFDAVFAIRDHATYGEFANCTILFAPIVALNERPITYEIRIEVLQHVTRITVPTLPHIVSYLQTILMAYSTQWQEIASEYSLFGLTLRVAQNPGRDVSEFGVLQETDLHYYFGNNYMRNCQGIPKRPIWLISDEERDVLESLASAPPTKTSLTETERRILSDVTQRNAKRHGKSYASIYGSLVDAPDSEWIAFMQDRHPVVFPREGLTEAPRATFWAAHPSMKYISVIDNQGYFQPCCTTNKRDATELLRQYFSGSTRLDIKRENTNAILTNKFLTPGAVSAIGPGFKALHAFLETPLAVSGFSKTIYRCGIAQSPHAILDCVHMAIHGTPASSEWSANARKRLYPSLPSIAKQEMYDASDNEIVQYWQDPTQFLDPARILRIVEHNYQCNVLVIDIPKGDDVSARFLRPRNLLGHLSYAWNTSRPTLIVVMHWGPKETGAIAFPHCEVLGYSDIVDLKPHLRDAVHMLWDTQNPFLQMLLQIRDTMHAVVNTRSNLTQIPMPTVRVIAQAVDLYGKVSHWILPLSRNSDAMDLPRVIAVAVDPMPPLNVPIVDPNPYVYSRNTLVDLFPEWRDVLYGDPLPTFLSITVGNRTGRIPIRSDLTREELLYNHRVSRMLCSMAMAAYAEMRPLPKTLEEIVQLLEERIVVDPLHVYPAVLECIQTMPTSNPIVVQNTLTRQRLIERVATELHHGKMRAFAEPDIHLEPIHGRPYPGPCLFTEMYEYVTDFQTSPSEGILLLANRRQFIPSFPVTQRVTLHQTPQPLPFYYFQHPQVWKGAIVCVRNYGISLTAFEQTMQTLRNVVWYMVDGSSLTIVRNAGTRQAERHTMQRELDESPGTRGLVSATYTATQDRDPQSFRTIPDRVYHILVTRFPEQEDGWIVLGQMEPL